MKAVAFLLALALSAAFWFATRPQLARPWRDPAVAQDTAPFEPICAQRHSSVVAVTDTPGEDVTGTIHLYTVRCLDGYVQSEGSNR